MKSTSPVLLGLAQSLASNAEGEPEDAKISFPPLGLLTYTPPLPMIQCNPVPVDRRDSGATFRNGNFLLDSNEVVMRLLEGTWDITINHGIYQNTAVDLLAVSEVYIQVNNFLCRISRFYAGASNIQTVTTFRFPLTVNAKFPASLGLNVENGSAVNTGVWWASIIASRLL